MNNLHQITLSNNGVIYLDELAFEAYQSDSNITDKQNNVIYTTLNFTTPLNTWSTVDIEVEES